MYLSLSINYCTFFFLTLGPMMVHLKGETSTLYNNNNTGN